MTAHPLRVLAAALPLEASARLADALAGAGFRAEVVAADLRGISRGVLADDTFDAVVAPLDATGRAALDAWREAGRDVPFVFLSDSAGEAAAVQAMKDGASDVLPLREPERLPGALEHALAQAAVRARHRGEQRELALTRDRFADLYESAPVACLTLAADGTVLQLNRAAAELLGQPREELSGTPLQRLVIRADAGRWRQHLERALSTDERVRLELRLRGPHGALVHVQADSARVREDGGPARVRVALTDISDRKEAEASLRRFESKLREVQKMESLGTLAGGIAHDFNNILAAILGNVELARGDLPADHRARTSLEEIRRAGLRARDLVNQILVFSRREPQELVTQALQPVMEETQRLLRATLPARVELSFSLPAEPVYVHADATQLQQVLMNLCTNAWHALKDGAGRIRVSLSRDTLGGAEARRLGLEGAGDYAHVEVADDGVGMDALTLARIFEPFFTTKPAGQGTGLGLSVVHGILAAHRGVADVQSAPGLGTTFHVRLPAVAAPVPRPAEALPAALPRTGDGERVLYVDDDETMTLMVERLLARAGYRVTCFTDPARALAALGDRGFEADCVVTDFNMPGASGLDVARAVGRLRPGLPVIVSTGYVSEELRSDAREAGVSALLEKQDTVQALADLVAHVMAGSVAG